LEADRAVQDARYQQLSDRFLEALEMLAGRLLEQAQGKLATEASYAPVPAPELKEPLPVVVLEAINERADPNSPTWRQLATEARKRLAVGVEAGEVAALVLSGEDVSW